MFILPNYPTLILHDGRLGPCVAVGGKTVPIGNSADRVSQDLPHATYIAYDGAPYGLFITDKNKLNRDLVAFVTGTDLRGGHSPVG